MIQLPKMSNSLKMKIQQAISDDPYGLSPDTMYKNVYFTYQSNKSIEKTSMIYNLSTSLVIEIIDYIENNKGE